MKISCPNCGHHYEVEEEFAGMSVDCSSCGKESGLITRLPRNLLA